MDGEIKYTLSMVDNISPTVDRISASQSNLEASTQRVIMANDNQRISFLASVQSVKAIDVGVRGLSNVFIELGVVGGKTAKQLQTLTLAVHAASSAFMLMKGVRQILMSLYGAEVAVAGVETYRAVLNNPARLVAVMAAIGATGAAVGYLISRGAGGGGGEQTVNNTITFNPESRTTGERETAKAMLSILGG